jgi:glutamate-5-semialdehyde dehydrogenase
LVDLEKMGRNARDASRILAGLRRDDKDQVIALLADLLNEHQAAVLDANSTDIILAEQDELSPAMIDRLRLTPGRLASMAEDLRQICHLDDPVGAVFDRQQLPNGLKVHKQRVPLGVLAVIYESRPNVTLDVSALSLKSGNAIILRGGKETLNTNQALIKLIHQALEGAKLPVTAVQFIDSIDRSLVMGLLQMYDWVDMLIPRGGAGLHRFCREHSRIPVITGGIGICHVFVDSSADQAAALDVIYNAKTQRPTVCNALDTVLVHQAVAQKFIPSLIAHLVPAGVKFRLDPSALTFVDDDLIDRESIQPAGEDDFDREWLSLVLGIRVVPDLAAALGHIQEHSTGHSDGILTSDETQADEFIRSVDSAAVYVNASTRFTDGGQLGLGAEVAISTQRLHARGPMALEALTTYKWIIEGQNHIRPD